MSHTTHIQTPAPKAYYDLAKFASHFSYGAAYIQLKHNLAKGNGKELPHFYYLKDVRDWLATVVQNLNLELVYHGDIKRDENFLIVSNHISWLDAVIFAQTGPYSFIAKQEVKSWPVIGSLGKRFDTQFIRRENKFSVYRDLPLIQDALLNKKSVVAFPEGTTTEGYTTNKFYPMLFETAVRTNTRIQPVAIRYTDDNNHHLPDISFVDNDNLIDSIARMFRYPCIRAHLIFLDPIDTTEKTRKQCALIARDLINSAL